MSTVFSPVKQLDQKAPSRNTDTDTGSDSLLSISVLFCLLTVDGKLSLSSPTPPRAPSLVHFASARARALSLSLSLSLSERKRQEEVGSVEEGLGGSVEEPPKPHIVLERLSLHMCICTYVM